MTKRRRQRELVVSPIDVLNNALAGQVVGEQLEEHDIEDAPIEMIRDELLIRGISMDEVVERTMQVVRSHIDDSLPDAARRNLENRADLIPINYILKLIELLPELPEPLRTRIARTALEAISDDLYDDFSVQMSLIRISPYLSRRLKVNAMRLAYMIEDDRRRSKVLSALREGLPVEDEQCVRQQECG